MKRFLLLLITVCGVVLLSGCSTPETTVRKYINASFNGDLASAKRYCDGNALKMVAYHEGLQDSIGGEIPGIAGEMTGLPSEGSPGDFTYDLLDKGETSASVRVNSGDLYVVYILQKAGSSWRIVDIEKPGAGSITEFVEDMIN